MPGNKRKDYIKNPICSSEFLKTQVDLKIPFEPRLTFPLTPFTVWKNRRSEMWNIFLIVSRCIPECGEWERWCMECSAGGEGAELKLSYLSVPHRRHSLTLSVSLSRTTNMFHFWLPDTLLLILERRWQRIQQAVPGCAQDILGIPRPDILLCSHCSLFMTE